MDGQPIPEIRVRKGSDAPSLGDAKDSCAAPMASFEAMSDLEESDKEVTSPDYDVFEEDSPNEDIPSGNVPPPRPPSPTSRSRSPQRPARPPSPRAASPSRPERPPSPRAASPSRPDRPPSRGRTPSPARPPSPCRAKSPARPPSPCRPTSPNLAVPGAKFPGAPSSEPHDSTGEKKSAPPRPPPARPPSPFAKKDEVAEGQLISMFDQEDSELVAIHGEGEEEEPKQEEEVKHGNLELEGIARERPRSITPNKNVVTLDDYLDMIDPAKQEEQDEVEKIKITLPALEKTKSPDQEEVNAADSWLQEAFSTTKSPEREEAVDTEEAPKKAPPPKRPAPPTANVVAKAKAEASKSKWETFGDGDEEGDSSWGNLSSQNESSPPSKAPSSDPFALHSSLRPQNSGDDGANTTTYDDVSELTVDLDKYPPPKERKSRGISPRKIKGMVESIPGMSKVKSATKVIKKEIKKAATGAINKATDRQHVSHKYNEDSHIGELPSANTTIDEPPPKPKEKKKDKKKDDNEADLARCLAERTEEDKELLDKSEKSKEYLAFMEMQNRITDTMSKTKEKVSSLEDNIKQTEEICDAFVAANSPWAALNQPGGPPTTLVSPPGPAGAKSPKEGWMSFGDSFADQENPKPTALPSHVTDSTLQASPQHTPIPPNNSRRESIEKTEGDLLSGNEEQSGGDLLGGLDDSCGGATLGADMMSLSRNPQLESAKSSAMSTPVHSAVNQDVLALAGGSQDDEDQANATDEQPVQMDDFIDDFLGITKDQPAPVPTANPGLNLDELLGKPAATESQSEAAVMDDDDPFGFGVGANLSTTSTSKVICGDNLLGGTVEIAPAQPDDDPFHIPEVIKAAAAGTVSLSDHTNITDGDLFGGASSAAPASSSTGTVRARPRPGAVVPPQTTEQEPIVSMGEEIFGGPTSKVSAMSPDFDFDPRGGDLEEDSTEAKPVLDSAEGVWGSAAEAVTAGDDNMFEADPDLFVDNSESAIPSTNPFAEAIPSTNPFADAVNAGEGGIFNEDPTANMSIFETALTSTAQEGGSFNPFATIIDEPGEHAEGDGFDPFQTITGDDAFVEIKKEDKPKEELIGRPRPKKAQPFAIEIREKVDDAASEIKAPKLDIIAPALPPPPKPVIKDDTSSEEEEEETKEEEPTSPNRVNPFDQLPPLDEKFSSFEAKSAGGEEHKADTATPNTILSTESSIDNLDEELPELPPFNEPFTGEGWRLLLRMPMKKKLSTIGNRYWKPVFVKLAYHKNTPIIKLFHNDTDAEPFHELHLQPSYNICDLGLQTFDQFGKCHTLKLQYVFYRERVGVKAERITPTLGDLARVRNFKGLKDLVHRPKTTMVLEHAPQASELLKFGGLHYDDFKSFKRELEDAFFNMHAFRDKSLTYTKDEITVDIVDEYYAEIDREGHITYHKGRVRMFCLAFITGMTRIEIGINDKRRKGKEIVGRHDIIPIKTDEWIRIEDPVFHASVEKSEFEKSNLLTLRPLDACQFELVRFRTRPRLNKELPLIISAQMSVVEKHIEIRSDVIIPGYSSNSRRACQTPCEDIQIRFPIPQDWIYLFRVEKRFKYGSIKAATRKPGKIKGLERLTMVAQGFLPPSLIEVTSGTAKYENIFQAVVWRIPRLPERNEGAYKTHMFKLQLDLGPHDVAPETYQTTIHVEYNMPNSTVSRAQVRSISLSENADTTDKWVHHLAKYEYQVEMELSLGKKEVSSEMSYATPASPESTAPESEHEEAEEEEEEDTSSDSSSDEETTK